MMEKYEIKHVDGSFCLTQQMAASLAGVSVQTMIRWGRDPDPPPRNNDGTYPSLEFGEWMRTKQVLKRGKGNGSAMPYAPRQMPGFGDTPRTNAEEKARLTKAQADKAEMDLAVATGKLVPAADVEEAWQMILMRVRTKLLKLPVALAPLVHLVPDVYVVQQRLKEGVDDALSEASDDWQSVEETEDA